MSSKGQIVIPESIRDQLNLKQGTEFLAFAEVDTIVLVALTKESAKRYKVSIEKLEWMKEELLRMA
jgi:AbrB family looped-hinge helix DNA binding protein